MSIPLKQKRLMMMASFPFLLVGISLLVSFWHELGHFIVARSLGLEVSEFTLTHVLVNKGASGVPEWHLMLIALAGPAFVMILGCISFLVHKFHPDSRVKAVSFCLSAKAILENNFIYLYNDMFLVQRMDFYQIYAVFPEVAGILLLASFCLSALLARESFLLLKSLPAFMKRLPERVEARPLEKPILPTQAAEEFDFEAIDDLLRKHHQEREAPRKLKVITLESFI